MDFQVESTPSSSKASSARHKDALFSLIARNHAASLVVFDFHNVYRLVKQNSGVFSLDVGFHTGSQIGETIAVIGRGTDADVLIADQQITRIQCSFELVREFVANL